VQYGIVEEMEQSIDAMNEELEPLKTFILPGGSTQVSHCHIARTVCRRAERRIVTLTSEARVDDNIVILLNRYSDYLFILSRYIAHKVDVKEIPWKANIKR
jgi:cob(I)alamin adenosyltransferase